MFRVLRYCRICLAAGMIGMLAGMAGQIVFMDLDELSFLVAFAAAVVFLYFCVVLEYRRWSRNKKRNSVIGKS